MQDGLTPKRRTKKPACLQQLKVWIKEPRARAGNTLSSTAGEEARRGRECEREMVEEESMVSRRAFSRAGVAPRLLKLDLAIATESGPHRVWATFRRGKDTKRVSMSKACAFWTYRPRDPCQTPSSHPPNLAKLSPSLAFRPRPAFSSTTPLPHPAAVWPKNPDPERACIQADTNRPLPDRRLKPISHHSGYSWPAARHWGVPH